MPRIMPRPVEKRTWWDINSPYRYRNDNLERLGFKSYAAYLKSDLWRGIRARVLERDGNRCVKCFKAATQAHHRAYDPATLKGENIDSLSSVCAKCHKKAEQPDNFRRASVDRLCDSSTEIQKRLLTRRGLRKFQRLPRLVKGQ